MALMWVPDSQGIMSILANTGLRPLKLYTST